MKLFFPTLAAAVAVAGAAHAADGGDVVAGKAIFEQRCAMCHSNAPGARSPMAPNLAGVSGRVSGTTEFTSYSSALKKAALTWNSKTLDQFLTGPSKMVPGTRMIVAVADTQKRADLVAYLVSLKKK